MTSLESLVPSLDLCRQLQACDDGWAASKMLWTRMQKWNDEWRAENPKERSLTLLDAMDLIVWKLAKARAEGAEQMRLKIVKEAFGAENEEFVSVPMSLLTPIPETPEEYYLMCEKAGLSPAPKEPTIYAVGDNGESGESHSAASSGGYWKATYVPPPEMTFGPAGAILAPTEPEVKP